MNLEHTSNYNPNPEKTEISFDVSRNLNSWLSLYNCSIIATSYKTNLVFSFSKCNEKINVWYSTFTRPMDIHYYKKKLYLGTQFGILEMVNNQNINKDHKQKITYDTNFVTKTFNITGDIDMHDIYLLNDDIYFVSSLLNSVCIIDKDTENNFKIIWTPEFITRNKINKLPNEDRCHLNSLCFVNQKLKYVSALSKSNFLEGWRNNRTLGIVINVETNEIICENLCMPHSLYFYNEKLYVLDSGTGRFGYISDYKFIEIAFIPGFLRGLKIIDNYAVIGSSLDRHDKIFSNLPLNQKLKELNIEPQCGIHIVNIESGDIEHYINLNGAIEIYGIEIIPDSELTRVMDINSDSLIKAYQY